MRTRVLTNESKIGSFEAHIVEHGKNCTSRQNLNILMYYCNNCRKHSIAIDFDVVKDNESNGCLWTYVYCPICFIVSHHDDVIANTESYTAKISGEKLATGSVN